MSTILFAEVAVVFEDVMNSKNFVNVSVCPLHIEFFSFVKLNHIFFLCLDWKRGMNPIAACQNVLACKFRVSSGLKHYVPKWFTFSHNFKQSNTVNPKCQLKNHLFFQLSSRCHYL